MQRAILFEGSTLTQPQRKEISELYPAANEILLKLPDGIHLHGWLIRGPEDKNPLVIYFGGNNDEVSWVLNYKKYFQGWSLLLLNYRGYGISEGTPSEKDFYRDAAYLYDTFSQSKDINSDKIIAMGRSMGTGVAVNLTANRDLAGTILISPYDSMVSVAKSEYPFLPAGLILKHQFNSIKKAPDITSPVQMFIAENDRLIPPELSRKLYNKWGGEKYFKTIPGENHSSISDNKILWQQVRQFLSEI